MNIKEFVVEFNDGSRDWIDPVVDVQETEETIIVSNGFFEYTFDKSFIKKWTVRPYSPETTFDEIMEY